MPLSPLIATDSLHPPLTGIGYYTAHLIDQFLRMEEVLPTGFDHQGVEGPEELAGRLAALTGGRLGDPSRAVRALPAEPSWRRAARATARRVPPLYRAARWWRGRRSRQALERAGGRLAGRLLHAPNYVPPAEHHGPLVVTVHDLSHIRHPETHPAARIEWLNRHLPAALARAARILAVSEFTKRELLELELVADPARIAVVPNGVDALFAPPSPERLAAALAPWGLEPGGYLLSVATLEPRKNLERLVDAYAALPPALGGAFPLVLAGASGWKNRPLLQRIARLRPPHRAVVTGYLEREELVALMGGAACFAYVSLYEGFGLPVLEAMAAGAAVLTADRGALAEVAGEAALGVDPESVEAIRAGLERLLEDAELARRLRAAGCERARRFPWQRTAEETLAVYREVLAEMGAAA
ncbi:MAG: hypothetical protein KatS3mg124_0491 [Porticoccaceae bacterium]|nr:MAG: hypothetical protein KatS3mg124_0491 [Porticoccaceae bacterium]